MRAFVPPCTRLLLDGQVFPYVGILSTDYRLTAPDISETDAAVVACALEKRAGLLLADDSAVRELAEREGLSVMGSVGILTQACLEGTVRGLKPLLDQLVATGFHLDPNGQVYQDALKKVGEIH